MVLSVVTVGCEERTIYRISCRNFYSIKLVDSVLTGVEFRIDERQSACVEDGDMELQMEAINDT